MEIATKSKMEYDILVFGWLAFFTLHSLLATDACKMWFRSKMGKHFRYYRLIYSFVALVTLGSILVWQFSIPIDPVPIDPLVKYLLAIPFSIAGATLMVVCIRKYFFKLSGVAVFYRHRVSPSLETRGVHRMIRHPLYIGTLLLIWGLVLLFPTLANLMACTLITIYVRIGISSEENKLVRIFGTEYQDYQRRTPMLIPRAKTLLYQIRTLLYRKRAGERDRFVA